MRSDPMHPVRSTPAAWSEAVMPAIPAAVVPTPDVVVPTARASRSAVPLSLALSISVTRSVSGADRIDAS